MVCVSQGFCLGDIVQNAEVFDGMEMYKSSTAVPLSGAIIMFVEVVIRLKRCSRFRII